MIVPILCLVSFCLLVWVLVLKMEIAQIKGSTGGKPADRPEDDAIVAGRNFSGQKGGRSFKIKC